MDVRINADAATGSLHEQQHQQHQQQQSDQQHQIIPRPTQRILLLLLLPEDTCRGGAGRLLIFLEQRPALRPTAG